MIKQARGWINPGLRIGDPVEFIFGMRIVQGKVTEDRGPLGQGGRRIYRVEAPMYPDNIVLELPVDDFLVREGEIDLAGIYFMGPYSSSSELPEDAGVFVVLDKRNGKRELLDVGETLNIRESMLNHPRQDCWQKHKKGMVEFAIYRTQEDAKSSRELLEDWLRAKFLPPCGKRRLRPED